MLIQSLYPINSKFKNMKIKIIVSLVSIFLFNIQTQASQLPQPANLLQSQVTTSQSPVNQGKGNGFTRKRTKNHTPNRKRLENILHHKNTLTVLDLCYLTAIKAADDFENKTIRHAPTVTETVISNVHRKINSHDLTERTFRQMDTAYALTVHILYQSN